MEKVITFTKASSTHAGVEVFNVSWSEIYNQEKHSFESLAKMAEEGITYEIESDVRRVPRRG